MGRSPHFPLRFLERNAAGLGCEAECPDEQQAQMVFFLLNTN